MVCFVIFLILKNPQVKGVWLPIFNAIEPPATQKRSVQRVIFFYSKTSTVIYHFDLIALITKDSVMGFFLKGNFLCIPLGVFKKCTKCLLHAFPIIARLDQCYCVLICKSLTFSSTLQLYTALRIAASRLLVWFRDSKKGKTHAVKHRTALVLARMGMNIL